jgi:hypothetical protein
MDRIGRDSGLWLVLLEALELLHLVFQLDARLAWTLLLEACGKSPSSGPLAFPLAWLDDTRPLYVLRFREHDVLDGFDQVSDILEIVAIGIAEWHHTPLFHGVEDALLTALGAPAVRQSSIDITCEFILEDSLSDKDSTDPQRLESLAAIKCLAAYLRVYQEPAASTRYWDDSAFAMAWFGLDFGSGVLPADELTRLTQIMLELSVSSLTFAAWTTVTPPPVVGYFCLFGVASDSAHAEQYGGLRSLTLYATDLRVRDRLALAHAIRTGWLLQEVTFVDHAPSVCVAVDGWLVLMLETLFGDHTESQVESVHLELSRTLLPEIVAAQRYLEIKYAYRRCSPRSSRPRNVEFVPIENYSFSVHDFTSPQADVATYPVLHRPVAMYLFPIPTANGSSVANVVLPEPAPYRLSLHPVHGLSISLSGDKDCRSTTAEAVALVWLVGEPLGRLLLCGPTKPDATKPVLTAIQLERVLTACPHLGRLELHGLEIESLEPLTDSSLSGNLRSLVIHQCHVQDAASVFAFYAALGDPAHDLHGSLHDLSMCEEAEDDTGNIESAHAALDMLAHNYRLERFVLHGRVDGVAMKLQHRFLLFDGQPVAGAREEMVPVPAKTAFLSVLGTVFGDKYANTMQLMEEASATVFEFAATPRRRHCAVVPV